MRKIGRGGIVEDPHQRSKIVQGGRVRLRQLDGFLWHCKNHCLEERELAGKWRESFQSDLKESIEILLDKSKEELQRLEEVEFVEDDDKDFILFTK